MGTGEDRLKNFRVDLKVTIDDPTLTPEARATLETLLTEEIKKNQTMKKIVEGLVTGGQIVVKLLKGAIIPLVFMAMLAGCGEAPKPVLDSNRAVSTAILHYDKNATKVVDEILADFATEAGKRLTENFEDALKENTAEGKILLVKARELYELRDANRAQIADKTAKARKTFEKARAEALDAVRLNESIARWMQSKPTVTSEDVKALMEMAATFAEQVRK